MHKFVRGPAPIDFAKYKGFSWRAFAQTDAHRELGDALYRLQDEYCAYCETHLATKAEGHIEHLERRSDHPEKTFAWDNLFFSCRHDDSCGHYKDRKRIPFNRADIVDPSREDPAAFFTFSMTGKILAKDGDGKPRAEETIRVFNLNCPALVQQRKSAGITIAAYFDKTDAEKDALLKDLAAAKASFISFYAAMLHRAGN